MLWQQWNSFIGVNFWQKMQTQHFFKINKFNFPKLDDFFFSLQEFAAPRCIKKGGFCYLIHIPWRQHYSECCFIPVVPQRIYYCTEKFWLDFPFKHDILSSLCAVSGRTHSAPIHFWIQLFTFLYFPVFNGQHFWGGTDNNSLPWKHYTFFALGNWLKI